MSERRHDEFYVGYLPNAPHRIGRFTSTVTIALFVMAVFIAILLAVGQRPFARSRFEYGVTRSITGTLYERPYPMLVVARPGVAREEPSHSIYYLSALGKKGIADQVIGFDGSPVTISGSLVYRDDATMIEVSENGVQPLPVSEPAPHPLAREDLGEQSLIGEIVDSKCFLGVMKPGNLKPHRSCAVRCISGGIPPVLAVLDQEGIATYYLLVSEEGEPVNAFVLDLVAEAVTVRGRVLRQGKLLMLQADPSGYERLGS